MPLLCYLVTSLRVCNRSGLPHGKALYEFFFTRNCVTSVTSVTSDAPVTAVLFIQCNGAATYIIFPAVVLSRRRYRRSPGDFRAEIPTFPQPMNVDEACTRRMPENTFFMGPHLLVGAFSILDGLRQEVALLNGFRLSSNLHTNYLLFIFRHR
jgi:hypothetical protein